MPANQFILSQLAKQRVSRFGRRYNEMDKNFALALHFYSPQCYKMLRKVFVLPTTRSLSKWLENANVQPGFNEPVLELLTLKSKTLTQKDRLCTIVVDEMSLKELVTYNSRADIFEGFVNTSVSASDSVSSESSQIASGNVRYDQDEFYTFTDEHLNCPQLANQAMVILVRGIESDFKQVVGYFLSHNAMCGAASKKLS